MGLLQPQRGASPPPDPSSPLSPQPDGEVTHCRDPAKGPARGGWAEQTIPDRRASVSLFPHPGLEHFGLQSPQLWARTSPSAGSQPHRCSSSPGSGVDTRFVTSAICPQHPVPPPRRGDSYLPTFWLYFNLNPVISAVLPPAASCPLARLPQAPVPQGLRAARIGGGGQTGDSLVPCENGLCKRLRQPRAGHAAPRTPAPRQP